MPVSELRLIKRCAEFVPIDFKTALKRKLVNSNLFADLKVSVKGNVDKFLFVTPQEAKKVFDACPLIRNGG
jgi:hypothetical protein